MASIHGPASTSAANMASSLGMNESVISLICVAAWNTLTTSPTTSAVSSSGADTSAVTHSACCAIVRTVCGVMGCGSAEARDQRSDEQVPPVHQHEQHELERQGDQHRRQHHHAHRHQHARHHHVDD